MRIHLLTLLLVVGGIFACEKSRQLSDREQAALGHSESVLDQQQQVLQDQLSQLAQQHCSGADFLPVAGQDPIAEALVQLRERLDQQDRLLAQHHSYWNTNAYRLSPPGSVAALQQQLRQDQEFIRNEQREIKAALKRLELTIH